MTLKTPKYILDAKIQDTIVRYKWNDWDVQEIFKKKNDELHQRLLKISYRANLAFISACGEWVIHRYGLLSDDQEPHDQMEASWAGIIDPDYSIFWEPPDENWIGPIRGALQLAMIFTLEAKMIAHQYGDVALRAVYASNMTAHVMTNPKPFLGWQGRVLVRLEKLYPYNDDDPMGDVVPREAFDPDFDFRPEMTEQLVQDFLLGLNPDSNPFLLSPKQMKDGGFKGKPYKFDIEADRFDRNDF